MFFGCSPCCKGCQYGDLYDSITVDLSYTYTRSDFSIYDSSGNVKTNAATGQPQTFQAISYTQSPSLVFSNYRKADSFTTNLGTLPSSSGLSTYGVFTINFFLNTYGASTSQGTKYDTVVYGITAEASHSTVSGSSYGNPQDTTKIIVGFGHYVCGGSGVSAGDNKITFTTNAYDQTVYGAGGGVIYDYTGSASFDGQNLQAGTSSLVLPGDPATLPLSSLNMTGLRTVEYGPTWTEPIDDITASLVVTINSITGALTDGGSQAVSPHWY